MQGTEKVILIQEQLSKNRVLVGMDRHGNVEARCTSFTTERKVQTNMITRHGKLLLVHSAFRCALAHCPLPLAVGGGPVFGTCVVCWSTAVQRCCLG